MLGGWEGEQGARRGVGVSLARKGTNKFFSAPPLPPNHLTSTPSVQGKGRFLHGSSVCNPKLLPMVLPVNVINWCDLESINCRCEYGWSSASLLWNFRIKLLYEQNYHNNNNGPSVSARVEENMPRSWRQDASCGTDIRHLFHPSIKSLGSFNWTYPGPNIHQPPLDQIIVLKSVPLSERNLCMMPLCRVRTNQTYENHPISTWRPNLFEWSKFDPLSPSPNERASVS